MKNPELKKLLKEKLKDFELSESYGQRAVGAKLEADTVDILKEIIPQNLVDAKSKRSIDDFTAKLRSNFMAC